MSGKQGVKRKPERIEEISEKYANAFYDKDFREDLEISIANAIKEALEEENRWFYPEKGELPDINIPIIFYTHSNSNIDTGLFYHNKYKELIFGSRISLNEYFKYQIKCWRYAPVVPEDK